MCECILARAPMDRRQFLALAATLAPIPAFTDTRLLRAAASAQIRWTDVHVHPIAARGGRGSGVGSESAGSAVDAAAAVMDGSSIATMFLLPPPQNNSHPQLLDYPSFIGPAKNYGAKFRFLGGGGTLNPLLHQSEGTLSVSDATLRQFTEEAEAILRAGAVGFGEIAAHHLSLAPAHPYESVPADHPLLLRLADIAARHDVPIDLHFDPVIERMARPDWAPETNPADLAPNFAAFERLLAHNRGTRIVWAHAGSDNLGQWTPELSHRMLATHPNLFMSLRMAPAHAPQNHPLTITGELKPGWRLLLTDFPDRFVIGGDQFFVDSAGMVGPAALFATRAAPIRQRTNVFLSLLPEQLAHSIAQANATRIYKL